MSDEKSYKQNIKKILKKWCKMIPLYDRIKKVKIKIGECE